MVPDTLPLPGVLGVGQALPGGYPSIVDVDSVALRPVVEPDLDLLGRFLLDAEVAGPNWYGFRDVGTLRRRFDVDGWLGGDDGRLMVVVDTEPVGFVGWHPMGFGVGKYPNIGIVLLPEWRGRGVGTHAQLLLCRYLFAHTPTRRIEAGTQPENLAEQRVLERIGFVREGTLRAAEFRDGTWRDIVVYGLLRGELREPGMLGG